MLHDISIDNRTTESVPSDAQFKLWSECALADHTQPVELAISLVDEAEMLALNTHYRDKKSATNVLAFPLDFQPSEEASHQKQHLGDIIICVPVVKSEAKMQEKSETDHFAHLTIHGILHLLGYDHIADDEAAVMEAREVALLSQLNITDPYQ